MKKCGVGIVAVIVPTTATVIEIISVALTCFLGTCYKCINHAMCLIRLDFVLILLGIVNYFHESLYFPLI